MVVVAVVVVVVGFGAAATFAGSAMRPAVAQSSGGAAPFTETASDGAVDTFGGFDESPDDIADEAKFEAAALLDPVEVDDLDDLDGFDESPDDTEDEAEIEAVALVDPVEVGTVDDLEGFDESLDDSEDEAAVPVDLVEVEATADVRSIDEPVSDAQPLSEQESEQLLRVDEFHEPVAQVADLPQAVDTKDLVETVDSTRPDLETAEIEKEKQEVTELIVQQSDLAEQAAEQKEQLQEAIQAQPAAPAEAHGQWLERGLLQTSTEVVHPNEHPHTLPTPGPLDVLLLNGAIAQAFVAKKFGK